MWTLPRPISQVLLRALKTPGLSCPGGDSPDYNSQTPEGAFARPAGEAGGRGRAGAPQLSATPGARRLPRCASLDPAGDPSMVRASTVGAHLPASGLDIFGDLRKMNKRQLYYQVLNFAMIVSSALMIWKGLIVLTGSESPIVVVLSGSMEPAFHRGDLLFLTNFREDPIRAGEIVVFKVEGRDIPIVHRVIKVHEKDNGDIKFLTKGDNNEVDDRGLYKEGQNWLEKKDVVGRARGFLPYVGMVTIIMNDYPKFKYALLAVMGAYVLLKRES
ncbi:hypothetical protein AB1E18_017330 [Capra hircus]